MSEETKQPAIENKPPSNENNSQPAQKKSKCDSLIDRYFPSQNYIDYGLKVMKLVGHVEKKTVIKERVEATGFTAVSFKGGFSTGSFLLDRIHRFLSNLLSDFDEPRKKKIMDEIDDQAWIVKFEKGDSLFIYHNGSGQEKNFGLELIPIKAPSGTAILYYMGTLDTTFTLARPFMIVEKTRKSFLREKTTQEIVYQPATYGPKQQQELNQMKIAFFSSMDVKMKRSLQDRDAGGCGSGCGGGCACDAGEPYKQLKS